MSFNDPIADYLTRIRNAACVKHKYVDIPLSKMKVSITEILQRQGFVKDFLINENKRIIRIFLAYNANRISIIKGLKRVSTPGRRKYVPCKDISNIFGGIGISIISTPKGILDNNLAKKMNVGGEMLCKIW